MTPSGIEPATFRFVAQYLNHCATISGPRLYQTTDIKTVRITCTCDVFKASVCVQDDKKYLCMCLFLSAQNQSKPIKFSLYDQ
jgi:hypothetical protein